MYIVSPANERLKRVKRLINQKKARSKERAFVVEGLKVVEEAINSGTVAEFVFASVDEFEEDDQCFPEIQKLCIENDIEFVRVEKKLFDSVVDTQTPQGIAAVVGSKDFSWDSFFDDANGHILVLVDVRDPGNLGTLIRTAEASGAHGVVLAGTCTDMTSPKVVRAASGSLFRVPIVVESDPMMALWNISQKDILTLATVVDNGVSYKDLDLNNCAILLGNEANGLTEEVANTCDEKITIPLAGSAESLNVAMAGTVLSFAAMK